MTIVFDPYHSEISALLGLVNFTGKAVLEIGCGDGRLTWQFARQANRVVGIDPKTERIEQAIQELPGHSDANISFYPLGLEEYAAETGQHEKFDLAVLSWSL